VDHARRLSRQHGLRHPTYAGNPTAEQQLDSHANLDHSMKQGNKVDPGPRSANGAHTIHPVDRVCDIFDLLRDGPKDVSLGTSPK
jgi:hypothetical protein